MCATSLRDDVLRDRRAKTYSSATVGAGAGFPALAGCSSASRDDLPEPLGLRASRPSERRGAFRLIFAGSECWRRRSERRGAFGLDFCRVGMLAPSIGEARSVSADFCRVGRRRSERRGPSRLIFAGSACWRRPLEASSKATRRSARVRRPDEKRIGLERLLLGLLGALFHDIKDGLHRRRLLLVLLLAARRGRLRHLFFLSAASRARARGLGDRFVSRAALPRRRNTRVSRAPRSGRATSGAGCLFVFPSNAGRSTRGTAAFLRAHASARPRAFKRRGDDFKASTSACEVRARGGTAVVPVAPETTSLGREGIRYDNTCGRARVEGQRFCGKKSPVSASELDEDRRCGVDATLRIFQRPADSRALDDKARRERRRRNAPSSRPRPRAL